MLIKHGANVRQILHYYCTLDWLGLRLLHAYSHMTSLIISLFARHLLSVATYHCFGPTESCRLTCSLLIGLRTVRLTGTAVWCLVRNGYGFTVHCPSNCVSKEPTETDGDRDGCIRGYGIGRVKKSLKRLCWRSEVSRRVVLTNASRKYHYFIYLNTLQLFLKYTTNVPRARV